MRSGHRPRPDPEPDQTRDIVDPDVVHDPAQRAETTPREWDLLAVMAIGGVVGAEARYAIGVLLRPSPRHSPGRLSL